MERITLAEVAKLANVSKATVSRVVSDSPLISQKTKDKVNKIIEELNYVPNSIAQNLSSRSSKILGIVLNSKDVSPLSIEFFSEILGKISDNLAENKYYTLFVHCSSNEDELKSIKNLVGSRRIDGLIFLRSYSDEGIFEYLEEINFPFVIIGRPKDENKYMWVDNDNVDSTYKVTKNIIEKGNRNICFLGGPSELSVTKARLEGYKKALSEYNIKNEYIIESNFEVEETYDKLNKFLENNDNIDAIVSADDILAISAIKVIESRGIKDIIVTGYNNSKLRKYGNYKFTTIEIHIDELAKKACELIMKKLKNSQDYTNHSIVTTSIIEEK